MYKSEIHFDENQDEIDRPSTMDLNQLASSLKSAIFSKYFSDYLIEKIEEVNNRNDMNHSLIDSFDNRCGIYMKNVSINIYKKNILTPVVIINIRL